MATFMMQAFVLAALVLMAQVTALGAARPAEGKTAGVTNSLMELCDLAGLVCTENIPRSVDAAGVLLQQMWSTKRDTTISTINDLQRDFFVEASLVEGGTMFLDSNLKDPIPKRAFLSAAAAKALPPLTSGNLQELLRSFNVGGNTDVARMMATTAFLCGSRALPGEARSCPTSAQAMGDFVAAQLGSRDVDLLATSGAPLSAPASKDPVTVGDVHKGSLAQGAKIVVCHNVWFPTQTFYCHTVTGTKVVRAALRAGDGSIIRGVGVCHLDTTLWASSHPAFAALNIPRGSEACHWLVQNDLVWVPSLSGQN